MLGVEKYSFSGFLGVINWEKYKILQVYLRVRLLYRFLLMLKSAQ